MANTTTTVKTSGELLCDMAQQMIDQGLNANTDAAVAAWYHFNHFGPLWQQHLRDCHPCWEHKTFKDF